MKTVCIRAVFGDQGVDDGRLLLEVDVQLLEEDVPAQRSPPKLEKDGTSVKAQLSSNETDTSWSEIKWEIDCVRSEVAEVKALLQNASR